VSTGGNQSPFLDVGCNARPEQKEFERQMILNTEQNILLVMRSHQILIQENKSDISYLKTSRAFDVLIHSGKPNSVG